MQVKRYCCRDVREALRRIRRELGPEAVIIGTRELPDQPTGEGGRPMLEVLAAIDREAAAEAVRQGEAASAAEAASRPARDLAWLVDSLVDQGLERGLAAELVAATGRDDVATDGPALRSALARRMAERVAIAERPWRRHDAKVAWLLGAAGVGKTTALAKIAAYAAYQEGRRVAIVNTDARPGAERRMEVLADAMGLTLHHARGPFLLRQVMAGLTGYDLVLIDTPPLEVGGGRDSTELRQLLAAAPGLRYLCLAADTATARLMSLARALEERREEGPGGSEGDALTPHALIATRVDEALGLCGVYSAQQALRRPLALLSTGPRVPDDVEVACAERLCHRILSPSAENGSKEEADARSRYVA